MDLLLLCVTIVINIALGLLVFVRDSRSSYARFFGLMSLFICVWITANYITNHPFNQMLAPTDITNRIAFVAAYGIVLAGLGFSYVFPRRRSVGSLEAGTLAIIAIPILILAFSRLVAGNVVRGVDGAIEFTTGSFIWLYVVFFIIVVGIIARNLVQAAQHTTGMRRRQANLILLAFCSSAVLGLVLNVVLPVFGQAWGTTRLGPLATVLLVVVIAYAIVKHGLFDIRLAVVRTLGYILSLLSLSAIYYFLAYFVSITLFQGEVNSSISINPINVLLALVLAFIFQPIKNFFDKVTNDIFYRDRYNSDEFYARLSEVLTSTTDLRGLLVRASREISETLKAEQAFFFVQYNHAHHLSAGTTHHTTLPLADATTLNDHVATHGKDTLITNLLPEHDPLHRLLTSHNIAVMMPLVRDTTVVGYLALGDQRSSGYTNRDIRVLQTVSDELVIAIQNALSVQEVKDLNIHLQQRIDAATKELRRSNTQLRHLDANKDEFLSMASHQLRTPLTSVKGYLSMVLEGDAGKVSKTQQQLLSEAYMSSERMVHLIHDFLNVSRLQTGKFMLEQRPINLVKLVDDEVRSLNHAALTRFITLHLSSDATIPRLNIDESKIQQVVMNFIDNALYYSHENTTIEISLTKTKTAVELRVKDNGIGVPKNEQAQLFTKFYRASNARKQRPDGTGVGLYLAKKVVVAHGGEVLFNSSEGKGSTFGFSLPLAALTVSDETEQADNNQDNNQ